MRLAAEAARRQHLVNVRGDARFERLQLGQRQVGQVDAQRLGPLHRLAGHMVGLAERQVQLAHQPVGEVGGGGVAGAGGRGHRARRWRFRSATMPVIAASDSSSASKASKAGTLSSCMSLRIGQRQALHHHAPAR